MTVIDAVVVPGRMQGPWAPLLMYTADVVEFRGGAVHRHEWSTPLPVPAAVSEPSIEDWVRAEIEPLLDRVGGTRS